MPGLPGYAHPVNQRRDARRNRARIIAAAAEVFREEGASAPLDLVALRADVGRGTLYRHFPYGWHMSPHARRQALWRWARRRLPRGVVGETALDAEVS